MKKGHINVRTKVYKNKFKNKQNKTTNKYSLLWYAFEIKLDRQLLNIR